MLLCPMSLLLIRYISAFLCVIRADMIMYPYEIVLQALGAKGIVIVLVCVVATVTLLLLWLLRRKKK